MLLIKCKCGCIMTVKSTALMKGGSIVCQNCGQVFNLGSDSEISEAARQFNGENGEIHVLPDTVNIHVNYDI